jgi:hypothetical protein
VDFGPLPVVMPWLYDGVDLQMAQTSAMFQAAVVISCKRISKKTLSIGIDDLNAGGVGF